jgi:hypothetical protein
MTERGNYNRSQEEYVTDNSGSDEPLTILVTAWHKPSPPKASVPWIQSMKFKISEGDNIIIIGFNDGGNDFSFENAVVTAVKLD